MFYVQLLAERGVPEGDVAEEAKRRATDVTALKAADEGVASVLLASAQVVPESFNELLCVSKQDFVSRNETPFATLARQGMPALALAPTFYVALYRQKLRGYSQQQKHRVLPRPPYKLSIRCRCKCNLLVF